MPRRPRIDYPGAIHHVYNRGIARRPVFEKSSDIRAFEALLARTVRSGTIEVHAFSILTTHFHLLLGSPAGRLGDAMQRIGNGYVRRFNRERRRDGSLFRGRYGSRLVESSTYFRVLLRYIDLNPVDARLADAAHRYRHASAWHYARTRRPPWLRTDVVEAIACDAASAETFLPSIYAEVAEFDADVVRDLVEGRMDAPPRTGDPLDDLVRAAPIEVQRWMARKTALADGTAPGLVLLRPASVLNAIEEFSVPDPRRRTLVAGLLCRLAGQHASTVARQLGCSESTAQRAAREHMRALVDDPAYAALAADVVHRVIRRDFGPPRRRLDLPRRLAADDGS